MQRGIDVRKAVQFLAVTKRVQPVSRRAQDAGRLAAGSRARNLAAVVSRSKASESRGNPTKVHRSPAEPGTYPEIEPRSVGEGSRTPQVV